MKFRAFFCIHYDTKNSKNIVWLSSNTIKKAFITAFRCFGKTFFFSIFWKEKYRKSACQFTDSYQTLKGHFPVNFVCLQTFFWPNRTTKKIVNIRLQNYRESKLFLKSVDKGFALCSSLAAKNLRRVGLPERHIEINIKFAFSKGVNLCKLLAWVNPQLPIPVAHIHFKKLVDFC